MDIRKFTADEALSTPSSDTPARHSPLSIADICRRLCRLSDRLKVDPTLLVHLEEMLPSAPARACEKLTLTYSRTRNPDDSGRSRRADFCGFLQQWDKRLGKREVSQSVGTELELVAIRGRTPGGRKHNSSRIDL
jgi:hypothetical protein